MRYCTKCIVPDTRPHLTFDENGVCDACRTAETQKDTDWDSRMKELDDLLDRYRNNDGTHWDCLIPVSGGKDSTFQVIKMLEKNMHPLAVTFHQLDLTEVGKHNLEVMRNLGVDHMHFYPNPVTYKALYREGFRRVGDPHWPNHPGIFSFPVRAAVYFKIPLVLYGENGQYEYGGPEDMRNNNLLTRERMEQLQIGGNRVDSMISSETPKFSLLPYSYVSSQEYELANVCPVFLGYFLKWDALEHLEIVKKKGWKARLENETIYRNEYLDFENVDTKYYFYHDYFCFLKYGFGRTITQASVAIRKGRLTRNEAIKIAGKHEGQPPSPKLVEDFCKFIEISEREHWRIIDTFANKSILEKDENGFWQLKEKYRLKTPEVEQEEKTEVCPTQEGVCC